MNLTIVYHFQSFQNEEGEFTPARYQVIYCFSGSGFIEAQGLKKVALSMSEADAVDLTFLSLDDLKEFALLMADEFDEDQVRLISVQDFNVGVDGAKDLSSFRQIFLGYGEVIQREGSGKRKKNFLSRFF